MISSETPSLQKIAELGVARISYGPRPYQYAMKTLKEASIEALALHGF